MSSRVCAGLLGIVAVAAFALIAVAARTEEDRARPASVDAGPSPRRRVRRHVAAPRHAVPTPTAAATASATVPPVHDDAPQPPAEEIDRPLLLTVRAIEAATGRPIAIESAALLATGDATRRTLSPHGDAFVLLDAPLHRGAKFGRRVDITPVGAWRECNFDGDLADTTISPLASAIEVVQPMWPRLTVRVRVVDDQGAPVEAATVEAVGYETTGSSWYGLRGTGADGWTTRKLYGFVVPGERMRLRVSSTDGCREVLTEPLGEGPQDLALTVALHGPSEQPSRRGGGCGGCSTFFEWEHVPFPGGPARTTVRVLTRDGVPAGGVSVGITGSGPTRAGDGSHILYLAQSTTGADGAATFEGDLSAASTIAAWAPGLAPVEQHVAIGADGAVFELREPGDRDLVVRVTDEDGRPVVSASVAGRYDRSSWTTRWDHAEIRDGVQLTNVLTDSDGRATLTGARGTPGRVRARWLGLVGGTSTCSSDYASEVVIVVR